MAGIQSILLLGESFTVYRETRTGHIHIFTNEAYSITLYVVQLWMLAVSEDAMDVRLLIMPDKPFNPGIDSVSCIDWY